MKWTMKSGIFLDKLLNFIRSLKSLPGLTNSNLPLLQLLKERLECIDAFILARFCEHHWKRTTIINYFFSPEKSHAKLQLWANLYDCLALPLSKHWAYICNQYLWNTPKWNLSDFTFDIHGLQPGLWVGYNHILLSLSRWRKYKIPFSNAVNNYC